MNRPNDGEGEGLLAASADRIENTREVSKEEMGLSGGELALITQAESHAKSDQRSEKRPFL